MEGWIKLDRSITEQRDYFAVKFDKIRAWIDLLLQASIVEQQIVVRGINVDLQIGDVAVSVRALAERWKWRKDDVQKFLKVLEKNQKVSIGRNHVINILHINVGTQMGTQMGTQQQKEKENFPPITPFIKKEKEIKEEDKEDRKNKPTACKKEKPAKQHFAEFVTMTEDEYQTLLVKYGQEQTARMVEILDNYKGSSGKNYKSDYRAILSWVVGEYEKNKQQSRQVTYGNEYANNAVGREQARVAAKEQRDREFADYIRKKISGSPKVQGIV